jgi:hypothetical protein
MKLQRMLFYNILMYINDLEIIYSLYFLSPTTNKLLKSKLFFEEYCNILKISKNELILKLNEINKEKRTKYFVFYNFKNSIVRVKIINKFLKRY